MRTPPKELGTRSMGSMPAILNLAKEPPVSLPSLVSPAKTPTLKLPQLNTEITSRQFQMFRIDWEVIAKMTYLPSTQTNIWLYNCTDKTIQNSIINPSISFSTPTQANYLSYLTFWLHKIESYGTQDFWVLIVPVWKWC